MLQPSAYIQMKSASREFRSPAQTEPKICSWVPLLRSHAPTETSALCRAAVVAHPLIWALTPRTGLSPRDTRSRLVMTKICDAGARVQKLPGRTIARTCSRACW